MTPSHLMFVLDSESLHLTACASTDFCIQVHASVLCLLDCPFSLVANCFKQETTRLYLQLNQPSPTRGMSSINRKSTNPLEIKVTQRGNNQS
eukprot:1141997-Pelagomonas_calceolata.AAC.12